MNLHKSSLSAKQRNLRKTYCIPNEAFTVFTDVQNCTKASLEQLANVCLQIITNQRTETVHFIVADIVKNQSRQRELDAFLRVIWNSPHRKNFHVYALESDIPPELKEIANCRFSCNETNVTSLTHSIGELISKQESPCGNSQPTKDEETITTSLIMRASNDETIKDAVSAAISTFPSYKEFIIAVSPLLNSESVAYINGIPNVRPVCGTADREMAGDLHYKLLDMCTGDWIINVDDDDLWVNAPNLKSMTRSTGLLHGDYLFLNYYKNLDEPYRIALHRGCPIDCPEKIQRVHGSMWIMRTQAWKSISHLMTDRSFNFSDWRAFHSLRKNGWTMRYEPMLFGIQRRYKYDFPSGPGNSWKDEIRKKNL